MSKAPEPTDIIWKNIPTKTTQKIWRHILTTIVMLVVLSIAFLIYFLLGLLRYDLDKELDRQSGRGNVGMYILVFLVSTITSLFVSVFNAIIESIIMSLSNFERHTSHASYSSFVAPKLALALFINTGLTPLLVNIRNHDWFNSSGLVIDVIFNTISVCYVYPLLEFYTFGYFKNKFIIWMERRKGDKSYYTQREMNKLHEGDEICIANMNAYAMLLIMISAFYVTLVPFLPLICFGGAIYQYWIEKYMFIRRMKFPPKLSGYVERAMRQMMPFVILFYGTGQRLFIYELSNQRDDSSYFIMWITFAYLLLPIKTCAKYFFCAKKIEKDQKSTYDENRYLFRPDYLDVNPVHFITVSSIVYMNLEYE